MRWLQVISPKTYFEAVMGKKRKEKDKIEKNKIVTFLVAVTNTVDYGKVYLGSQCRRYSLS